jgi:hypothetical protein
MNIKLMQMLILFTDNRNLQTYSYSDQVVYHFHYDSTTLELEVNAICVDRHFLQSMASSMMSSYVTLVLTSPLLTYSMMKW